MKAFNLDWWLERAIDVPDHYFDWMAPRYYLLIVAVAYLLMGFMVFDMLREVV
jgi:hypothetical protein